MTGHTYPGKEFPSGSSGQVIVVTRSGTSQFHGSAYEFFRNEVLTANNFLNKRNGLSRPPLRYNNFGFSIGGPVPVVGRQSGGKNATFFFYSEEWRRVVDYSILYAGTMPTPSKSPKPPGWLALRTIEDEINRILSRAESKFCAPSGGVCTSKTVGLLVRRHIVAGEFHYIGKEASTRWAGESIFP